MNKIVIVNDKIISKSLNKDIKLLFEEKQCLFSINKLIINILNDTSLILDIEIKEKSKLELEFNINKNSKLNLDVLIKGIDGKIQYKFNLEENSYCTVDKFNNIKNVKEMSLINLLGEKSNININFKTIASTKETYDYMVYHKFNNTVSNIKNNGVNIKEGQIIYQVSTFIPKDINGCSANQFNRIINLTDNKCEIRPNLYIDSYDVNANHSALIGKFSDDELFYMQSRGIDVDSATNLLIKGFLLSNIESNELINFINNTIDEYWR